MANIATGKARVSLPQSWVDIPDRGYLDKLYPTKAEVNTAVSNIIDGTWDFKGGKYLGETGDFNTLSTIGTFYGTKIENWKNAPKGITGTFVINIFGGTSIGYLRQNYILLYSYGYRKMFFKTRSDSYRSEWTEIAVTDGTVENANNLKALNKNIDLSTPKNIAKGKFVFLGYYRGNAIGLPEDPYAVYSSKAQDSDYGDKITLFAIGKDNVDIPIIYIRQNKDINTWNNWITLATTDGTVKLAEGLTENAKMGNRFIAKYDSDSMKTIGNVDLSGKETSPLDFFKAVYNKKYYHGGDSINIDFDYSKSGKIVYGNTKVSINGGYLILGNISNYPYAATTALYIDGKGDVYTIGALNTGAGINQYVRKLSLVSSATTLQAYNQGITTEA